MGKRGRPDRTARRVKERAARQLVRDRERLASLEAGGSPARPIVVVASSVIDLRLRALRCPQCQGGYQLEHEEAAIVAGASLRTEHVRCQTCGIARRIYFRIVAALPS